jgi:nitrilase
MKVKIAAIQLNAKNDLKKNLSQAESLMNQAVVEHRPTLMVLPEVFSFVGEKEEVRKVLTPLAQNPAVEMCVAFAKEKKIAICAGSILLPTKAGKATNTCLFISPEGKIIHRYDKIHLFNYTAASGEVYAESEHIQGGSSELVFLWEGITFGVAICYDLRFPELFRRLAVLGAEVILVPSAFTKPTGQAHFEVLVRARAIENQVWMVAANQTGNHFGKRDSFGHSMIVDPWGKGVAQAGDEVGSIAAEVDMDLLKTLRQKMPCLKNTKFDLSALKVKKE